jgi:hypothetical protein
VDTRKQSNRETLAGIEEDLETLTVLEEVAHARQKKVKAKIEDALEAGVDEDALREGLGLSEPSIERIVESDPPPVHERLGISEESAESLKERATPSD